MKGGQQNKVEMEAPAGHVVGEGQRANKSTGKKTEKEKKRRKRADNRGGEGWSAGGASLLPRLSHAQMFGAVGGEARGGNRGAEKVRDTTSSEDGGGGRSGDQAGDKEREKKWNARGRRR